MSLHKFLDENEIQPYSVEGKLIGEAWEFKQSAIEKLQKQVEVLKESLEFYVDPSTGQDWGERAKAALEKIKEVGGNE